MRTALLGVAVLLLGGCATEQFNKITGYAPDDGSCRLDIVDHETHRVVHSEPVRGKFSIGLALEGTWPRRIDIVGVCNGRTVKSQRNLRPSAVGWTDLGSLGP